MYAQGGKWKNANISFGDFYFVQFKVKVQTFLKKYVSLINIKILWNYCYWLLVLFVRHQRCGYEIAGMISTHSLWINVEGKQNVYYALTFPILIQPYQIIHRLSKISKSKDVRRNIVSSSCHQRTYAKLYLNVFVQITEQV